MEERDRDWAGGPRVGLGAATRGRGQRARHGPERVSRVDPRHPGLILWDTVIGKKIVMAVTGVIMVCFVVAHMFGNLKIFIGAGEFDAYSRFLRDVGSPALGQGGLLWLVRVGLLVSVVLHVTAAVQLTQMSWTARPIGYDTRRTIETTFSARTMRWGGVALALFVIFHILHFTVGAIGFRPGQFQHGAVYHNVVIGFSGWPIALLYIVAMAALCLHLDHGTWSVFQTLGWNTAQNTRPLKMLSRIVALVLFVGFVSVPVAVLAGWLR